MVHYTTASVMTRSGPHDYWKLPSGEDHMCGSIKSILKKHGFKYATSADKSRLVELYRRCRRGLLSYHGCTLDELKAFYVQRKFSNEIDIKRLKKTDMVKLLEEADEEAHFDKFLDLPPELRVRVCELHFKNFPLVKGLSITRLPPITTVSSLIRQETVKFFFQTCPIDMRISPLSTGFLDYSLEGGAKSFWITANKDQLAMIRKVRIKISCKIVDYDDFRWLMDLGNDNKPAKVLYIGSRYDDRNQRIANYVKSSEGAICRALERAENRSGGKHLTEGNVKVLLTDLRSIERKYTSRRRW